MSFSSFWIIYNTPSSPPSSSGDTNRGDPVWNVRKVSGTLGNYSPTLSLKSNSEIVITHNSDANLSFS